jgi:hypothetical protein
VLDHVASGALYQDYVMLFGNLNTFQTDVKLSAAKFYYVLDMMLVSIFFVSLV